MHTGRGMRYLLRMHMDRPLKRAPIILILKVRRVRILDRRHRRGRERRTDKRCTMHSSRLFGRRTQYRVGRRHLDGKGLHDLPFSFPF